MKKYDVAFIGSCGIPNTYGGFEAFLEAVCPALSQFGKNVLVTCDPSKHNDCSEIYQGVHREFIDIRANGWRSTLHDLVAFLSVYRQAQTVYVLGVSAGPFFLLFRLLSMLTRTRLVVNIDGIEWRRGKFKLPVKCVLWIYDYLAQLCANTIVYDNLALLVYVKKPFRRKSVLLAYTGDHVVRMPEVETIPNTALTICRIEPENNIEELIIGALNSLIINYTIIGNWANSEYGVNLKAKYASHKKLTLLDPVYDRYAIARHREAAAIYLHGHSVGGSNPSLIEMLSYRCKIICKDCAFNRETAASDANYYNNSDQLVELINELIDSPVAQRSLQERYTTKSIVNAIVAMI